MIKQFATTSHYIHFIFKQRLNILESKAISGDENQMRFIHFIHYGKKEKNHPNFRRSDDEEVNTSFDMVLITN